MRLCSVTVRDVHVSIGTAPAIAVLAILLVSMIAGFVSRLHSFSALMSIEPWTSLPEKLMEARNAYLQDAALARIQPQEFDVNRINARITALTDSPNFKPKGWRLLVWKSADWIVGAFSLKALDLQATEPQWRLTAQAAWRVASVLWLITFQMLTLLVAMIAAVVALVAHA